MLRCIELCSVVLCCVVSYCIVLYCLSALILMIIYFLFLITHTLFLLLSFLPTSLLPFLPSSLPPYFLLSYCRALRSHISNDFRRQFDSGLIQYLTGTIFLNNSNKLILSEVVKKMKNENTNLRSKLRITKTLYAYVYTDVHMNTHSHMSTYIHLLSHISICIEV